MCRDQRSPSTIARGILRPEKNSMTTKPTNPIEALRRFYGENVPNIKFISFLMFTAREEEPIYNEYGPYKEATKGWA
jgi:hypothetical protein